jgi:hypothetical protein
LPLFANINSIGSPYNYIPHSVVKMLLFSKNFPCC